MLYWNACTKSLDRCYAQLKLIWPNSHPQWHWCLSWHRSMGNLLHGLKASPGAVIFGQDMLFDIPFVADWHEIGGYRQSLTDRSNQCEDAWRIDYDYKVADKVLVMKEGILRKAESNYDTEPWTITTVHMNGTIRIQCRTRTERLNFWRVMPFTDKEVL